MVGNSCRLEAAVLSIRPVDAQTARSYSPNVGWAGFLEGLKGGLVSSRLGRFEVGG